MSSNSSTSNNISNEHLILINMLKQMYTDNIHQINSMTNSINNIKLLSRTTNN